MGGLVIRHQEICSNSRLAVRIEYISLDFVMFRGMSFFLEMRMAASSWNAETEMV